MDFSKWKRGLKTAMVAVTIYLILATFFLVLVKMSYLFKLYLQ